MPQSLCAQSCLTLCHPMGCSPPAFSVHGIFQARILEWFLISDSRGSSCCLFSQLCLKTLCNPMHCSPPGFPVLHCLLEFTLTHVHWADGAIQPSYPLSPPFFSCPQSFQASGSFPISQLFTSVGQSIGAFATVLPMNIQGWFPLGLTGLILLSKGLSRVFSSNSSGLSLLHGPSIKSVHDYWKNYNLEYIDLCQQSDVCG